MNLPLKAYWDLLSRHIAPQKNRFVWLVLLLFGSIVLQIINPQIMRSFIDSALGGGTASQLLRDAAAFIAIALVQQGVSVGVTYLGESVAWTATNALRAELAEHCLNLDMSFHNTHTPGELIERIDGDVTLMANFFSQFAIMVVGNALLLVGVLAALFRENAWTGLVFSVFAAVTLTVMVRLRGIAVRHHKDRRQAEAELSGFIEETLTGTEDVRSSGAGGFIVRELFRLQGIIMGHDRKAHQKGWVVSDLVPGGLMTLGNVMAITAGFLLYSSGSITLGTVYLFIHYANLLESPVKALTRQVENFQAIGASVERLSELRAIQSRVADGPGHEIGSGALSLDFENVNFAYHDAPEDPVLHEVTFSLSPGRVLGLLGRTGSGKTTLTRLVFRMADPLSGVIRLGESNLSQFRLHYLRQRVAVVTQEVQLFRATLRDNLTFFDRDIPDEILVSALEDLGLGEWYRRLPEGLDTKLAVGGRSLSAGEGQLLALTRVFLRDPGLVILDEASSRLDPLSETLIEKAMDKLLKGRTAIVIAHRLNTVQRADEIMILDEGRVSEHGPREVLVKDPTSHFYGLLQTGLEEVLV